MSRRGYPILGRLKLRFLEVNIRPLKPGYIIYKILEVDLRTSLGARSRVQIQGQIQGSRVQIQGQIQGPRSQYLRS